MIICKHINFTERNNMQKTITINKAVNHPELMITIGGVGVAIGCLMASFWFAWARIQVSN